MPIISVVIPLYNKAKYISSTINTVLNQTVRDFELLVINDGSTDDSEKIAAAVDDPRIKIIHQKNAGVSAARNRGIAEASSDFIAFLDADDEWDADHIEALLDLRQKYPNAGIYSTDQRHFENGTSILKSRLINISSSATQIEIDFFDSFLLAKDSPIISPSIAINKHIIEEIGGYIVGFNHFEDIEFYARIALNHSIAFTLQGIVTRCIDRAELSKQLSLPFSYATYLPSEDEKNRYDSNTLESSFFIAARNLLPTHANLIPFLWYLQLYFVKRYIEEGRRREALSYFIRAYKYYGCFPPKKFSFAMGVIFSVCLRLMPTKCQTVLRKIKRSAVSLVTRAKTACKS